MTGVQTCALPIYNVCRIKDAEPAVRDARLKLADTTRRVLEIGLDIIGVTAPEKM